MMELISGVIVVIAALMTFGLLCILPICLIGLVILNVISSIGSAITGR